MGAREVLLEQLKVQWTPLVPTDTDVEKSIDEVMEGIKKSGFGIAFKVMKVSREDIKKVLKEIVEEKKNARG